MLDNQTQGVLEDIVASGFPGFANMTVEDARAALIQMRALAGPPERVPTRDQLIDDDHLRVRIYTPDTPAPRPGLVYFHGGGFVCGSVDTIDAPLRALSRRAGCTVVSVDYRLAPEHRFPAAADDAFAATAWVEEHADEIGVDRERIGVAGDSCGGGLAAVTALRARERGSPSLACQVLIYPMLDPTCSSRSQHKLGEGYLVTREDLLWFWRHYLPSKEAALNPHAAPLLADRFDDLPPALVVTAEYDPLRDEGESYAAALSRAGVPVELIRLEGMIHACFQMAGVIDRSAELIETVAALVPRLSEVSPARVSG